MSEPAAATSPATARQEIDALYTPLDEALIELRQRRAKEKLAAAVVNFHATHPPTFLPTEPCAVLFRHILTPNREFEHFVATISNTALCPLGLEYTEDRFCARNVEKHRLCRPVFEMRANHFRSLPLPITHFAEMDRHALRDLKLTNNTALPVFYHNLLQAAFPNFIRHLHDLSAWVSPARTEPLYYLRFLALFIRDGILFDNFLADDPEELRFARERVIPSFAKAIEIFGVRPLIVPLLPRASESDDRWRSHPGSLYEAALALKRQH